MIEQPDKDKVDLSFNKKDDMKDSGERTEFETGSVRDKTVGKGRFDLIPFIALERHAKWSEKGVKKYGERNWELGQPLAGYLNSGSRHLLKLMDGQEDEDHLAAVLWNVSAYIWTENEIIEGRLPVTLLKNLHPKLKNEIEGKIAKRLSEEWLSTPESRAATLNFEDDYKPKAGGVTSITFPESSIKYTIKTPCADGCPECNGNE